MQTRSRDENSVCPTVCQTRGLWQNERKLCPHSYTTWKTIYPSFMRRMVGGATPSTWNFGSTDTLWSEIADFQLIIARSASAVTSSEKSSIDTNRQSTTRFPMSPRWSSYVVPKPLKGGSKTQCPKFEQAAITPKRYEIGYQLLLITIGIAYGLSIGTDLDDLE